MMTKTIAIATLKMFLDILGNGYHPESDLGDYVNTDKDGKESPSFNETELNLLDTLHEEMRNSLGDDIWQEIKNIDNDSQKAS